MENKIKELIEHHKLSKLEVYSLLEELNQIDSSKISKEENNSLELSKARYMEEYAMRNIFINDLESLL